jgi:hypothetical protein
MQRNDPVHQESVPTVGGNSPAITGDRFTPPPLNHTAIAFLKQSLERNRLRRSLYRAGRLRVYIDGEECWQCDPRSGVYEPFSVPRSASYLEIIGDDDDGELLLAVFPLPEPEPDEAGGVQRMCATLEGGQTVAVEMALGDRTGGEVCEYCIRIAYSASVEVDARGAANPAVKESSGEDEGAGGANNRAT